MHSFIYVDYGVTDARWQEECKKQGFLGYRLALSRPVRQDQLVPAGWLPSIPPQFYHELQRLNQIPTGIFKPFFARWTVFERCDGYGEDHGQERFSLLFICEEGVTMYQGLYARMNNAPLILSIIQPGGGLGGNFTDFRDPSRLFAGVVLRQQKQPSYMVCGGLLLDYDEAFWPLEYPRLIEYFQHPRGNGLWGRADVDP